MLTLTRKAGQKIRIGDRIEIVVREVRGKQVRLGIIAPEGLPVYREELYQQIAAENQLAAMTGEADLDRLGTPASTARPVVLDPSTSRNKPS
jgi:carbon storage regulator